MGINSTSKSSRFLQGRRYTHDSYTDSQEAFTSVLDINANEVYTDQNLIPTSSLPFSGSSQSGSIYSVSGQNIMKYYYRIPMTKSNLVSGSANEVWFVLNPTGSSAGIGAQVIDTNQQTNFISPKYSIPTLGTSNAEDSPAGYGVKVFVSTNATTPSAGDQVSVNNYAFDYKTGVLQFATNALSATTSNYVYISAYQYVGRSLATTSQLAIVTASIAASTITFTKGNGTTFDIVVSQSGSVDSASYASFAVSSSYALSSSYAQTASYFSGSITNALNALALNGTASSVFATTGSNIFTGTQYISGSVTASSYTGSFVGNGSGLTNVSADFATTANAASTATSAGTAQTASYVLNAVSASYVTTASYVRNAISASYVKNAATASYIGNDNTASYAAAALTSSFALKNILTASVSASTITFAKGDGSTFDLTVVASGSVESASYALYAVTSSYAFNAVTASNALTSSFTITSQTASYVKNAQTASYIGNNNTASYAAAALTSSFSLKNVTTASVNVNIITFTKGDGSTFDIEVAASGSVQSASYANFAESANSASYASASSQAITASYIVTAQTASYVRNAVSASYSSTATSASYAATSTSASYASTASYTLTAVSAISAGSAISASYASTASLASKNISTASVNVNTITFTKGDGSTFDITVTSSGSVASSSYSFFATSASYASTASYTQNAVTASYWSGSILNAVSSSYADNANLLDGKDSTIFATTGSNIFVGSQAITGSLNISGSDTVFSSNASLLEITGSLRVSGSGITGSLFGSSSYSSTSSLATKNIVTASVATNVITFTKGDGTTFDLTVISSGSIENAATASYINPLNQNVTVTGSLNIKGTITADSGSFTYLTAIYETASIIYTSGSNQLGDASNDTQTLWGTVNLPSGSLIVTGSATSTLGFTGSLFGTASYATNALTASYLSGSITDAISASYAYNADLLDGKNSTVFATTSSNTFKGNQIISGSIIPGGLSYDLGSINNPWNHLYVSTGSMYFTDNSTIVGTLSGISAGIFVSGTLSGSIITANSITASLLGTASYALNAVSASYAPNSTSGSYAVSSSFALTASYIANISNVNQLIVGLITASVNSTPQNLFLINSGSREYFNISGSGNTTLTSDLFIVKNYSTSQPVLTVSQSIVQIATHSIEPPTSSVVIGGFYFTSTSLYIGTE